MFYSHEILASPQYGVATVWLFATLGANNRNRKLNRKAIEGVNVPQACDTIENPPGAPIALRLQGSLLYGVSGVYKRKNQYLLEDVEKMWAHMRAFYRTLQQSASSEIDINAGRAKRTQLILVNDPNFVPTSDLPALDFDEDGNLLLPGLPAWDFSQRTNLSSQLSPLDRGSLNAVSPAAAPFVDLGIRHSSSQGSLKIPSPFGDGLQKQDEFDTAMAFGDEEVLPFADFGLTIDADGNLVEHSEPELPPHPQPEAVVVGEAAQKDDSAALPDEGEMVITGDEDQIILGDDPFAEEEVLSAQQEPQQKQMLLPSEQAPSSEGPQEPEPRQRNKRNAKYFAPDPTTYVAREEFKSWTDNYVARVDDARRGPHQVTTAQAKKNAYNLTFGMGIMGIGILNNIPGLDHPLARFFAGEELKAIVMGDVKEQNEEGGEEEQARARRRRSASDAFGEEDDIFNERRVKRRADEAEAQDQEPQIGRDDKQKYGQDTETIANQMGIFDDNLPEMGREHPGSAISDNRRSSNAPWNRHSSVVPSSIHSQKGSEAGRHAVQSSPLVGRGSILAHDPRFSEGDMPEFGYDGLNHLPDDGTHDLSSLGDLDAAAGVATQEANTSQVVRKALDREGRSFLSFVERIAAERGEPDAKDEHRRWVEFGGLFEDQDKTKPVVAQAFLHVLTLLTRGQIRVKQEGVKEKIAYGEIRIGVTDAPPDVEQPEDLPEQMEGVEADG